MRLKLRHLALLALAILIPANAFPGAQALDWAGLGGALVLLGTQFAASRARRPSP